LPTPAGQSLLNESAAAHGVAALRALNDLSVSYDGSWRLLIDKLQPVLVDPGFRVKSEERLLPREGVMPGTGVVAPPYQPPMPIPAAPK
jgi:hypothetical protein